MRTFPMSPQINTAVVSGSDGGSDHVVTTHNCLACSSQKSCQKVNVIHYVFSNLGIRYTWTVIEYMAFQIFM